MEHFCTKHNTQFFKSKNMKTYAHPITGTNEWCNETEPATPKTTTVKPADKPYVKPDATFKPNQLPVKAPTATESSTAFRGCIELLSNGIITPDSELGKKTLKWANDKL